jgi:hypothetical protein
MPDALPDYYETMATVTAGATKVASMLSQRALNQAIAVFVHSRTGATVAVAPTLLLPATVARCLIIIIMLPIKP